jgi:hypothetical protein
MREIAVVAKFEVHGGTEKNHEIPELGSSIFEQGFEKRSST